MVENGKLDTQTYLLLDRTVNRTLASRCQREALNHRVQGDNGETTTAGAAAEGVQPQDPQRKETDPVFKWAYSC